MTTPSPISDQAAGGWKLVPIAPTPDMAKAGMDQWYKTFTQHDLYVAMVNAAPTQGADARPVAISEAMAEALGETGAPHSEVERKLYEAYCKGHCWEVGQWTGTEYYEMLDRIRFAMWRDRAALATHDAAPIPSDCDVRKILLRVVPGDGSGLEVYAENVQEVEGLLSEMGERLETYDAARATAEQSAPVTIPALFYNGDTKRDPALRAACDEQVRSSMAAATAHRDSVIEECAMVCDDLSKTYARRGENGHSSGAYWCADNIRALKSQQDAAIESQRSEKSNG